jgi:hypothetical protein
MLHTSKRSKQGTELMTYAKLNPNQFAAAVDLMDENLIEKISATEGHETPQAFLEDYARSHEITFGERFEPAYLDGQW